MTDFIELPWNEDVLPGFDGVPNLPVELSAGDTVTGTIGQIYNVDGPVLDQSDNVVLNTIAGQSYTVTVSGYSDNNSYRFFLDGDVVGSDAFLNGETTFTYTFVATGNESTFNLAGIGVFTETNYTVAFEEAIIGFTPTQGDDNGVGTDDKDIVYLLGGNDTYDAGLGYDKVKGGAGNDTIDGNDGNDIIFGDDGADEISGGNGHDSIRGGNDGDLIAGGDGVDRIWGDAGDDVIDGEAGNDTIDGGTGDDIITGGTGNDRIKGGLGNDDITGGDGKDNLSGWQGDDVVDGGNGSDILNGNNGNDLVLGGEGNDAMRGGGDDDLLDGGAGRDNMFGDAGNDIMIGGTGDDKMSGGSGSDTFVFVTGHGADTIRDFDTSQDLIDFGGILVPFAPLDETFDPGFDGPFPLEPVGNDFEFYSQFATQDGANVVFTIDGGDSVTLLNTNLGDLSEDNFILPANDFIPEILG